MPASSSTTKTNAEPAATERPFRFCSLVSEASGEDPAGSAWSVPRYVVAELPLPWGYDLLAGRQVPAGLRKLIYERQLAGEDWGFIGIAPDDEYSLPGTARVIDLRLPPAPFREYERIEYLFPVEAFVPSLRMVLDDPEAPVLAPYRLDPFAGRDLLVCTHGAVDACCAKFGYPIYRRLRQLAAEAAAPVRVWRCTHFGGHRFAATLLDLPDGRYWGRLTADNLAHLVRRDTPTRELRGCYRGWAALPHPLQQIAEAEAFARFGWVWTEWQVATGKPPAADAAEAQITFTYSHPAGGGHGEIAIDVRQIGTVTTLNSSVDPAPLEAPQYQATVAWISSCSRVATTRTEAHQRIGCA